MIKRQDFYYVHNVKTRKQEMRGEKNLLVL